jgi:hypothetical protein
LSRQNGYELKKIAEARIDLIVRFFAVAISVGFATSLSRMDWVQAGAVPTSRDWQDLMRLLSALLVVISGWEWFHRDTRRDETCNTQIFIIDILEVVIFLIFLLSFQAERVWLYCIGMIFIL